MTRSLPILLLLFLLQFQVASQVPLKCGNHSPSHDSDETHKQFLKNLQDHHLSKQSNAKQRMEITIPLQLHIIRNDDGSEVVAMSDIQDGLDRANNLFSIANIQFEVCGEIRYVNSTADKDYTSRESNALINPDEANPNALNVYYFDRVFVETTEVCGLGGAEVYMGCATGNTLAHEIGHHYTLRHTHGAYNFDPPNYNDLPAETNGFPTPVVIEGAFRYFNNMRDDNNNQIFDCMETGDEVCDTPAEPVGLDGAFNFIECTYFGTASDFYGDLYVPAPGNVMSYGSCEQEFFTPLQLERAVFSLNTTYLNEQCGGCSGLSSDWTITTIDDFGQGSLRWAYACNRSENRDVNISFNVPEGNTIELLSRLPNMQGRNVFIDGMNQATGEKMIIKNIGLSFDADNVHLKNVVLDGGTDPFFSGIVVNEASTVVLEECEIYNSDRSISVPALDTLRIIGCTVGDINRSNRSRTQLAGPFLNVQIIDNEFTAQPNSGLYLTNAQSGTISGNRINDINGTGMNIRGCSNLTIDNNTINNIQNTSDFDGDGILLSGGSNFIITRNKVENCSRAGVITFSGADFIRLGSYSTDHANTFKANEVGINANSVMNLFSGINYSYCNTEAAYRSFASNNNKLAPSIFESGPSQINGFAEPLDTIIIYTSSDTCSTCQPEQFLGLAYANTNGEWVYDFSQDQVPFGLQVLASASSGDNSSSLSACRILEVPIGCDELVTEFSYQTDFETDITDEFRILGEDFSLFNTASCIDNDAQVLFYNARNATSNSSVLYTKTFDLIGATFAVLKFDIAHGLSFTNRESILTVEVSADCGVSYESVYNKRTWSGLRTTSINQSDQDYFPGSCDEWRRDSIDLFPFTGQEILIKITASLEGSFGQNIFLDNILVDRAGACPTMNTSDGELYIDLIDEQINLCQGEQTSVSYDFTGDNIKWFLDGVAMPNFDSTAPITESVTIVAETTNNFGCRLYDTLTVSVFDAPSFDLGDDILACQGDSIELISTLNATEISWSLDDEILDQVSPELQPQESGTYVAHATINGMCPFADTILVTINEFPEGVISNDTLLCSYSDTQIELTTDAPNISWTLNNSSFLPMNNKIFTTDEAGRYEALLGDSLNFCSTTLTVDISKTESINLNFTPDSTVCFGEGVLVEIDSIDGSSTLWITNGDSIIAEGEFSKSFSESGTYRFEITDPTGCLYEDEITIQVLDTIPLVLATSKVIYCAGDTAFIDAQSTASIVNWKKDGTIINEEVRQLSITTTGTYEVLVENDIGCSTSASIFIEFTEIPVTNLGEDLILCEGSSALLEGADLGFEYLWVLDNVELPNSTFSLTTNQSGTYSLTQIDSIGCNSQDEVNVQFIPGPFIELPEEVFTCPNTPVMLAPNTDAQNLQWFFNDENIEGEDDGSLLAIDIGTYTLVGTGESECEVMARVDVLPYELPIIPLEESYTICPETTLNLNIDEIGIEHLWKLEEEVIEPNNGSVTLNIPGSYSVEVTDINSCITSKEFIITTSEVPLLLLDELFEGCEGDQISIAAESNSGATFTWSYEDEVLIDENENTILASLAGTYQVEVTNEFGCTSERTAELVLNELPIGILDDSYTICFGEMISIDAGEHDEYLWSDGSSEPIIDLFSTEPEETITETLELAMINELGCTSFDTTVIVQLPMFDPIITANMEEICFGDEVVLSVDAGSSFNWIGLSESSSSINVSPDSSTTFSVEVQDDCTQELTFLETTVIVNTRPNYTIISDTCILNGDQIQLFIEGVDSALWNDHPSFITETDRTDPTVAPSVDESYMVEIFDSFGCMYQDTVNVCVEILDVSLTAPNVITPGDFDGINDALIFDGLEQFPGTQLIVFNRWGNEIFTHESYQSDDRLFIGRTNAGKELPGGNYFYILTVRSASQVIKSSLTILR